MHYEKSHDRNTHYHSWSKIDVRDTKHLLFGQDEKVGKNEYY